MKKLFYSVAFGDKDFEYVKMTTASLKTCCFFGDIVVFTDKDRYLEYGQSINVRTLPNSHILQIENQPQRTRDFVNLDFKLMKTNMPFFYDISNYDVIMYADTDVLFINPFDELWELSKNKIIAQKDLSWGTVNYNVSFISSLFTIPDNNNSGCCAGFFIVPKQYYSVFDKWTESYLYFNNQPKIEPLYRDQPFFNYVLNKFEYPYDFAPKVHGVTKHWEWAKEEYALHFWVNHHDYMKKAFNHFILPKLNQ